MAAAVLLVALTACAVFGGGDFGGGVWNALARGRRAGAQRESIFRAMGPVWETHHVWLVLVVLLVAALPAARWDAAPFWEGLAKASSLALLGCAAAALAGTLVVLWRGWFRLAPFAAAAAVAFVLAGWGVVQYPYLILPGERISDLAAMATTLRYFLIALPIGAVILVPSLVFLYVTFSGGTEPERSG